MSGVGTWLLSMRRISVSLEHARLKMRAEALTEETTERAAFRAALMADVAELRRLMKECEVDRDALRTRVNSAEEQIVVLNASNQILERWIRFFKERKASDGHLSPRGNQFEEGIGT
ncbi:MAG TPA: hypothetical protein VGC09_08530 [Rhodopila sp.]